MWKRGGEAVKREWLERNLPVSRKDTRVFVAIMLAATGVCFLLRLLDQTGNFATLIYVMAALMVSRFTTGYLYGLLAHYCLDSICHPFVHLQTDTGPIGHTELEVEFDRHLMMLDGIPSPETEDFSPWFRLTRGECLTVSEFYPPATAGNIHTAVWNIRCISRLLAMKNRPLLAKGISLFGDSIRQQMILSPANHKCMHLNKDMEAHYQQALEKFPVLVEQLFDHLEKGAPLGDDFAPTFG